MNMEDLRELAELVYHKTPNKAGTAYLVGGSVRDSLMNNFEPKDFDVEVYGLSAEQLREVLNVFARKRGESVNEVGAAFSVFKVGQQLDVSMPRRETKTGVGHKAFTVVGDPHMTCEEAARRRDFTINAMMLDLRTGELLDFFGGQADLEARVIRIIDKDTFKEDSLRVLRAAQFASRFLFSIDPYTVKVCREIDLTDLPAERIWMEMEKLLVKSENPSMGLFWLKMLGATHQLFPELVSLIDSEQSPEHHPEGTVETHTALVVDRAREQFEGLSYPERVTLMLAALAHDFGKPATQEIHEDGRITNRGHAEAGVPLAESFMDKLKIFTIDGYDVRSQVLALVRHHLMPFELHRARDKSNVKTAIRRLALKVDLNLLYRVSRADALGRNYQGIPVPFTAEAAEWFKSKVEEFNVPEKGETPILMGRHLMELGYKPGKQFGACLKQAFELQLAGELSSLEEALVFARGWFEVA